MGEILYLVKSIKAGEKNPVTQAPARVCLLLANFKV